MALWRALRNACRSTLSKVVWQRVAAALMPASGFPPC